VDSEEDLEEDSEEDSESALDEVDDLEELLLDLP